MSFGPITIDIASDRAYINDVDMGLQPKELALLRLLLQHPEKTMNAEHLYEKVWGHKMLGEVNAIRKTIHGLRRKMEGSGFTITVVRNEGYIFERE
jgi:two-component system response regulator TctD